MSGHSKWANIRRAKAITDAKKGKVFGKLARNIILAAQQGGGDPKINFSLRLAVDRAKSANMPSDNIERAIKRGIGEAEGTTISSITYEAYGPGSVAMLIDCQTDNTNRALNEVREIIDRRGGKMVPNGSVSWQFIEKGVILLSPQKYVPSAKFGKEGKYVSFPVDDMLLDLFGIDGVEDVQQYNEDDGILIELIVPREQLNSVHNAVLEKGYKVEESQLTKIPKEEAKVDGET